LKAITNVANLKLSLSCFTLWLILFYSESEISWVSRTRASQGARFLLETAVFFQRLRLLWKQLWGCWCWRSVWAQSAWREGSWGRRPRREKEARSRGSKLGGFLGREQAQCHLWWVWGLWWGLRLGFWRGGGARRKRDGGWWRSR